MKNFDKNQKNELLNSDNYEKVKETLIKTRKIIKEMKTKNHNSKDHYLNLISQINKIKFMYK